MIDEKGIHERCRTKEPALPDQQEATAGECGHRTSLAKMKFCLACSIHYRVCRACGGYLKGEENDE